MNFNTNKVELVNIPAEIDSEDLKIVFESNVFGYQTVIQIKDQLTDNNQFKNVIIEFNNSEAAKQIAKSGPVRFNFGHKEMQLRPVLYLENISSENNSTLEKMKDLTINDKKESHSCWIGNVPTDLSKEKLEDFFKKETQGQVEKFDSIKLLPNENNKYQCYINLFSLSDAQLMVDHFNGSKINNCVLEARLISGSRKLTEVKPSSKSDSDSESSDLDQQSVCSEVNKENKYQSIFRVQKSGHFKSLVRKHIDQIKLKIGEDISIDENVSKKGNISFKIVANDKSKLTNTMNQLKSTIKIIRNRSKFTAKEFAQIQKFKSELNQMKSNRIKDYLSYYLKDKKYSLIIEFFDSGNKALKEEYFKYLDKVKTFLDEKIESEKKILLSDSDQFEYFKLFIKNNTDLKYNIISKYENNFNLNVIGKKNQLDSFDWSDLAKQLKVVNFTFKIKYKGLISYMNFKLRLFKSEFEKNNLVLSYDKIEFKSDTFSFKIVSNLNQRDIEAKANEIVNHFDKVY